MKLRILTAINLVLAASWIVPAIGTLGDFERPLRNHVLFRDGSTTLTGSLTDSDGDVVISPDGRIVVRSVRFLPDTTATADELLSKLQDGEMVLWRPGGSQISMAVREKDQLTILRLDKYEDREPGEWYDYALRWDGSLYLLRSRQVF